MPFESLDFVYNPSRDVKRDVAYFTELAAPPRLFLLADHVEGDTPIIVYRVANLRKALTELTGRGWSEESIFTRPFHTGPASFEGRRDF